MLLKKGNQETNLNYLIVCSFIFGFYLSAKDKRNMVLAKKNVLIFSNVKKWLFLVFIMKLLIYNLFCLSYRIWDAICRALSDINGCWAFLILHHQFIKWEVKCFQAISFYLRSLNAVCIFFQDGSYTQLDIWNIGLIF